MDRALERSATADLRTLLAAIARSTIFVRPVTLGAAASCDNWSVIRQSEDVDGYVLAWIASHRRAMPRRLDA